jgi:Ca2+-binding EF-hand superfamily protein
LIPVFQDFDQVRTGCVTSGQFQRVLSKFNLLEELSNTELEAICDKFSVKVGGRVDINYAAFCLIVDDYAAQ